ncbi:hypothetical protein H2200_005023 [Cladophialophora chaetospira]|uniref:Clr5 domain-containing protein n=1 Tax=Cladophialophora chaetospira TaxID=386627 RepID=A0AA39CJF0_9EURO|nr:hypothetical protein H2200_005023 [Cladophialophora chaetospira]
MDPDAISTPGHGRHWTTRELVRCLHGLEGLDLDQLQTETENAIEEELRDSYPRFKDGTLANAFEPTSDDDGTPPYKGALAVPGVWRQLIDPSTEDIPQPPNSYRISETEAKAKIKVHSTTIFSARNKLQRILRSREHLIRKRWEKKTKAQRTRTLHAVWPEIPNKHRPDIQDALGLVSSSYLPSSSPPRDDSIYKWPHLNIEDLVEPKNLLLLLNSRGHSNPDVFAHADRASCSIGLANHKIRTAFLPKYVMIFIGQDSQETYGTLVHGEKDAQAYLLFIGGVHFHSDIGLLILEVQHKLYDFLLECCYQILSDVPQDQLDAEYLPKPLELNAIETSKYTYSDLTSVVAGVPYRVPATLDTNRLAEWIEAKRDAAEDHAWSIREDPGYFKMVLLERARHKVENLRDEDGNRDPALDSDSFWAEVIRHELDATYKHLLWWDMLYERATELAIKAPNGFENFDHLFPLPEDVESILLEILGDSECYAHWCFSSLSAAIPVSEEMGINCIRVKSIRGTNAISITGSTVKNDILVALFEQMFDADESALKQIGIDNVVDEIQRIITADPKQIRRFSPFVWEQYSGMAFAANVCRLVRGLHPWSSSFHRKARTIEQTVLKNPQVALFKTIRATFNRDKLRPAGPAEQRILLPLKDSLAYPIDRGYTAQNVETLRRSEWNLDSFWRKWDIFFYKNMGETLDDILRRYSKRTRTIYRTLPYRPMERRKPTSPAVAPSAMPSTSTWLPQSPERFTPETPGTKVKTRGAASSSSDASSISQNAPLEAATHDEESSVPQFRLKERALAVFHTLFRSNGSDHQQSEVDWKDFLHAMTKVGFSAEKLYGSVWHFTPMQFAAPRGFHVHEPHPENEITPIMARDIGRRLTHTYGWTAEDFGEV